MSFLVSSAKTLSGQALNLLGAVGAKVMEKLEEAMRVVRADRKGWLICMLVLAVTAVRSGITYSFGAFLVPLKDEYKASMTESINFIQFMGHKGYRYAGLLGTVILGVSCMGTSFVPNMEWLLLTHSLLYGVGSSLLYMSSSLIIGDYFNKEHKYHVLATSILLCGYPLGSLLFNPINAWMITAFTWRTAFRFNSGLVLVVGLVCCWNFTARESASAHRLSDNEDGWEGPDPQKSNIKDDTDDIFASEGESGMTREKRWASLIQEIRQRPEIALWFIANCLSYLGFYMPFVNLASYMQEKERENYLWLNRLINATEVTTQASTLGVTEGSVAVTLLSLSECVTYIVASFLGDYLKDSLVYVNIAASGALTVICFVWPIIDVTYWVILAISLAMGGFLGLNIVYTYAASGEVTGLPIDVAWSLTNFWSGIGILIGPISGIVFDIMKDYKYVFVFVGVVYLVDTGCFAAIPFLQRRRQLNKDDTFNRGTKFETFRIKRSSSRSSVKDNGEVMGSGGGVSPGEIGGAYGTLTLTEQYSPPPPQYSKIPAQLPLNNS